MAKSTPVALTRLIKQLLAEREQHVDAIAAIDQQFGEHGIATEPRKRRKRTVKKAGRKKKVGKKRGRKKTAKKKAAKKSKTRRSYAQTADEFVLGLLKGGKSLTTAEINGKWKQAQRAGTADNTLTKLSKAKKLNKKKVKGDRGSRYTLAKRRTKKQTTKTKTAVKKSGKKISTKKTSKKKSSKKKTMMKPKEAATPQQAETPPTSQS